MSIYMHKVFACKIGSDKDKDLLDARHEQNETRAPRGTDRSPEYKEHFCYKLEPRVKSVTTEWNQKRQHFITHALDHCYDFGLLCSLLV